MLGQKRPTLDVDPNSSSLGAKRRRLSLTALDHITSQALSRPLFQQDDMEAPAIELELPDVCNVERPVHDTVEDALFRQKMLAQLEKKTARGRPPRTWGELNNQVMHDLFKRASRPVTDGSEHETEAYFLTGGEAEVRLESRAILNGPIITEKQQQFRWHPQRGRPIEQLFRRIGNLNKAVSVQKPSLSLQKPSCRTMQLSDVQSIFQESNSSEDSINVLELRNPLPRSILPQFLTGEDCQLLSRVRDTVLEGTTEERCTASVAEWNKWKDDEDWVLLAQGGAQTLTHQDSCGKATWLTVQQGRVGFGWISCPTEEERRIWSEDPNEFTGGKPRYVVLCPGQTVFFDSGTIHFVFRLAEHPTLMLGGHVLRWSRVDVWMEIVLNQLRFPNTTNEDPLPSAPVYVETVSQLISSERNHGRTEELGGEEAIARFFQLREVTPSDGSYS